MAIDWASGGIGIAEVVFQSNSELLILKQIVKFGFTCNSCGGSFKKSFKPLILNCLYEPEVPRWHVV